MFFPNKHLFIHIPKTGGSSLSFAMANKYYLTMLDKIKDGSIDCRVPQSKLKNISRKELQKMYYDNLTIHGRFKKLKKGDGGHPHSFISEYKQHLNIDDYVKFVVLRNPFEQVVSLYNQLRKYVDIPSLNYFILNQGPNTIKHYDHYLNQHDFTHIDGDIKADKVFVFDRYDEAQKYVEDVFKLKVDKSLRLWKTEYTDETLSKKEKNFFEKRYHKSIELYNRFL